MAKPGILNRTVGNFKALFKADAFEGILLISVAVVALVVANSGAAGSYFSLFNDYLWSKDVFYLNTLHLWINDGLMAIFFFVVGLEVKRELVCGNLADPKARTLPVLAAIAGMAAPIGVFLLVTGGDPQLLPGMAIPAATDIAFAMGIVGLLGTRVPRSLRLFLLTVAIVDDIGAVAIIAIFYSDPNVMWLGISAAVLLGMIAMNRLGISSLALYILGTLILWYCVLNSGVHATIAGVLAAFTIPVVTKDGTQMLENVEHALVPWSAYLVVPIFGFANAGVSLEGLGLDALLDPLPLAIASGLVIGKQVGIFSTVWLAVKTGIVSKPPGCSWVEIWGVSILTGIGFTMSLFIGELAFEGSSETMRFLRDEAKIGILTGSLISAVMGYVILRLTTDRPESAVDDPNSPVT
ncbi:Na+/H+ antiporter NhaA [Aurantiacibacter gangjinensis]|uniref:Na(+)/H(+) antiporter NhaA n=1 Tax=Aurantiacibacter gangjinensis TaxID=502682 RepID=A0A0G9MS22_9SPHN|nr:Na+/H+ antiporter NhaA [Aurantiacibacter gangjinensis]APE27112.1 Na+/H+ antiporter NhaA type [Aurantiacibacter gangjinensis]KLE33527.1 pH-dependent sodium/proton antiporter [Aurantiacibacter gangjinensis]